MTLLTMVQAACDILSVPRPSSVIAAADQTARTLLSCAQREGKSLAARWSWQAMVTEKTFTSVATETQTGAVPTDFKTMLSGSFFNRTMKRPVYGPLTGQEWQAHTALTAALLFDSFRFRGSAILLKPVPTAGWTYAFEYVSTDWCQNATGTVTRSTWAADDDVGRLDEELMMFGIIWRFKQSRGLQYDDDRQVYEAEVIQAMARDGSRRVISLDGSAYDPLAPRYPGVPDGSWSL